MPKGHDAAPDPGLEQRGYAEIDVGTDLSGPAALIARIEKLLEPLIGAAWTDSVRSKVAELLLNEFRVCVVLPTAGSSEPLRAHVSDEHGACVLVEFDRALSTEAVAF